MGISYFAPQAYTKETLAEAFEWLKKQPAHVKQFTKSADELVSLYLNSKKQGGKVSESFIKDLAGLAKDLEAFEEEKQHTFQQMTQQQQPPVPTPPAAPTRATAAQTVAPQSPTPQPSAPKNQVPIMTSAVANPVNNTSTEATQNHFHLDIRSQEFINQTKHRFNLNSDGEALRMLIVLGYEKIQSI